MEHDESNRQTSGVFSRTARIAVSTMLASAMCIPVPAIAQERQAAGSGAEAAAQADDDANAAAEQPAAEAEAQDAAAEQTAAPEAANEQAGAAERTIVATAEDAASTLTYSVDEAGNATITGTTDTTTVRDLVIPDQIDGHPVTAIEAAAFQGHTQAYEGDEESTDSWLLSVSIPDSVKAIGGYAFGNNKKLQSVRLPEQGCEIGAYDDKIAPLFFNCDSLKTLRIPSGIKAPKESNGYGHEGLLCAPALESVTFSDSIDTIPQELFANCTALKSVTIPDGITHIPDYCFSGCTELADVSLPASMRGIGEHAFSGCGFTSIDLPENVSLIGSHAFEGCGLQSISFPDSVKTINGNAFANCVNLSYVDLPKKGVHLGGLNPADGTFYGCTSLTSITLPDGIAGGGLGAPALTNVSFAPGIREINGLGNCTALTTVEIPDTVTEIGDDAFHGCTALSNVTMHNGLEVIMPSAFAGCEALRTVELPNTIKEINGYAFAWCTSLEEIDLPADTSVVRAAAFKSCTSLKKISLPNNIRFIASSLFEDCSSLTSISIPLSVQEIEKEAFYNCSNLTDVTITPSTTTIDDSAFELSGMGTITCVEGSTADSFAKSNGFATKHYADTTDYQDVSNSSVYVKSNSIVFDGTVVEPEIDVYVGSQLLSNGTDYDMRFENNDAPGTATIVITGKGQYHGTRTFAFQINKPDSTTAYRLAGEEAADTSAKIAQAAFPEGSEWVVVARDDDFADAMSATGLAGALGAPIVLTSRYGLSEAAADAVQALHATKDYVIGGRGAIPGDLEGELAAVGCEVKARVFGEESWDTSVACAEKIAEHNGNPTGSAIVAMSSNFQDALSISSFAYKYQVPIYLETDGNEGRHLTKGARLHLQELWKGTIYVPGGTGAVPADSVEDVFGADRVERIWGEDGYDTSNQIATYMVEHNLLSASTVCVASGAPDPKGVDALAGAALAGRAGGVMLLANDNAAFGDVDSTTVDGTDSTGAQAFLTTHAKDVRAAYLLGGQAVVGTELQRKVDDLLK